MESDLKDILGKASGPGDLATILIAGSLGYVLDAGIDFLPFMEPGAVSIIVASGVLGFKKAVEAAQEHRLRARIPRNLATRVLNLIQLFEEVGREDLVEHQQPGRSP